MPQPLRLLTGLLLLWFAGIALAAQQPVKSPNDPNEYRYLELDNGLRAILVSDPSADKAGRRPERKRRQRR